MNGFGNSGGLSLVALAGTAAIVFVCRGLIASRVFLYYSQVFDRIINYRGESLLCAGCSHFESKTKSNDAEQSGEVSHTCRFMTSKILRLIGFRRRNQK